MGNSGSSYQYQQEDNGPSKFKKMGRGWTTHSYPRELQSSSRYSKPSTGQKVLPELPHQMNLRPLALTLPHDLNKNQISNHYQQFLHHQLHHHEENHRISHCGHCRITTREDSANPKENSTDLKKFKSEPDLRYSMRNQSPSQMFNSHYYPGSREFQERELRYRAKKKYQAPPPPSSPFLSKSVTYSPENLPRSQNDDKMMHNFLSPPPPPPRKSRLFKTRAESKMSQINSHSPCSVASLQNPYAQHKRGVFEFSKNPRSYQDDFSWQNVEQEENDKNAPQKEKTKNSSGRRRRFGNWKNKNTLQRSLSSPEFQAELIQAPKKVRTKFEFCEKDSPLEEVVTCCSIERRRKKKKSIYSHEMSSKLIPKEARRRKSDESSCQSNGRNFSSLTADLEKLDCNQSGITKSQQKVHNRNLYYVNNLPKIENKSKSSYREINYLNSRLNSEDKFLEKMDKSASLQMLEKTKLQVDLKVQNNLNETEQDKQRNRPFESAVLVLRKEQINQESDEERNFNDFLKIRRSSRIDKENSLSRSRRRKENSRVIDNKEPLEPLAKMEKKELKKEDAIMETKVEDEENCLLKQNKNTMPTLDFSKPKTFYFGMDEFQLKTKEFNDCVDYEEKDAEIQANLLKTNFNNLVVDNDEIEKETNSEIDDIALKLRPTLPKKPPEVPRFSPSSAWKLLSAIETSARSTVSDEAPVLMLEEEIERFSSPPPFLMALQDPRSSQGKSGDSGISGDAGAINDDSFDINRSPNRIKPSPLRATWTPQQDLDEESSSSEAVINSPYPLKNPTAKFPIKPHVFSLSLPREENRSLFFQNFATSTPTGTKTKQDLFFYDSLQKLKRSVSGALGLTSIWDSEKKRLPVESFDDNWLLSTSAPTSLQNYYIDKNTLESRLTNTRDRMEIEKEEEKEDEKIDEERSNSEMAFTTKTSTPPFSSYLVSRGHVMYLPDPESVITHSNLKSFKREQQQQFIKYKKAEGAISNYLDKSQGRKSFIYSRSKNLDYFGTGDGSLLNGSSRQFSKSCENISYNSKNETSKYNLENLDDIQRKREEEMKGNNCMNDTIKDVNSKMIFNLRPKKFTFQSTVRQIERRRLAEKLSKEAEAKEKQRKNELEAMNKVEEEFQRKRSREKANIRQQLRLYSMDENRR